MHSLYCSALSIVAMTTELSDERVRTPREVHFASPVAGVSHAHL